MLSVGDELRAVTLTEGPDSQGNHLLSISNNCIPGRQVGIADHKEGKSHVTTKSWPHTSLVTPYTFLAYQVAAMKINQGAIYVTPQANPVPSLAHAGCTLLQLHLQSLTWSWLQTHHLSAIPQDDKRHPVECEPNPTLFRADPSTAHIRHRVAKCKHSSHAQPKLSTEF